MKQTFGGLQQSPEELAREVEWLGRQLFGANSERRILDEIGQQMILDVVHRAQRAAAPEIEIATHCRGRAETANET